MTSLWLYYLGAVALLLANGSSWLLNLISLPGNWVMIGFSALFAWALPQQVDSPGVRWNTIGVLVVLAIAGEIVEMAAGAAGAAKQGASRRSVVFSVLGTVLGSSLGLAVGLPIPLLGSAVAAILGGTTGAFVGAYLGETSQGQNAQHGMRVAHSAFSGRLWGTAGKLSVGVIMLVLVTFDSLF